MGGAGGGAFCCPGGRTCGCVCLLCGRRARRCACRRICEAGPGQGVRVTHLCRARRASSWQPDVQLRSPQPRARGAAVRSLRALRGTKQIDTHTTTTDKTETPHQSVDSIHTQTSTYRSGKLALSPFHRGREQGVKESKIITKGKKGGRKGPPARPRWNVFCPLGHVSAHALQPCGP